MPCKTKAAARASNRRSYRALMAIPAKKEQRARRHSAYMRQYYARNAQHRLNAARNRDRWRAQNREWANFCNSLHRYKLTLDQYHARLESQDFLCALCQDALPEVIDHNHQTDEARGLLCWSCNSGFGQLRESPKLFLKAIACAQKWNGSGAS